MIWGVAISFMWKVLPKIIEGYFCHFSSKVHSVYWFWKAFLHALLKICCFTEIRSKRKLDELWIRNRQGVEIADCTLHAWPRDFMSYLYCAVMAMLWGFVRKYCCFSCLLCELFQNRPKRNKNRFNIAHRMLSQTCSGSHFRNNVDKRVHIHTLKLNLSRKQINLE